AGTPIVIISAILWLLSNFGLGFRQRSVAGSWTGSPDSQPVSSSKAFVAEAPLDSSFAAEIGHGIEPALRPMGVDWRVGVGLISAFAAREVFVSTMAIVFHVANDADTRQEGLLESMRTATFAGTTTPVFTSASVVGLIVFFFISLQCLSTVSVVKAETGSWKIAGLQLLCYTGLGYLLSTATVQVLHVFGVR